MSEVNQKSQKGFEASKRSRVSKYPTLLAITTVILALSLSACGGGDSEGSSDSSGEAISVSLVDSASGMSIDPSEINVKSGDNVVLNVVNDGTVIHNLSTEDGNSTADLDVAASAELEVGEVTEDVVIYCTIAGHREQGMEAKIVVE